MVWWTLCFTWFGGENRDLKIKTDHGMILLQIEVCIGKQTGISHN